MFDIRPVLFINGILLLILAAAMGVPLLVDLAADGGEWIAFLFSAMLTAFTGATLALANQIDDVSQLHIREAFLLTVSSWVLTGLFGSLPFLFSSLHLSIVDGVFESISGLTTTGATILTGLDNAPRSILMWRALLQWLGGMGVIATALVILPVLHIGGMQMFRMENSDKTDKAMPRISQMAWAVLGVYLLLTAVLGIGLLAAGMTPLEAVCHAMSAISTGGFSTSDASLGHFSDAARWVCVVGMLIGGGGFSLYISPWRGGKWTILSDSQIRWYLLTIVFFSLLMTFWNWAVRDMGAYDALSQSTLNVVSVLTTSGFHSHDYNSWGGFAQVAFFCLAFVGGCTGSTAGGIKVFRYEVLFAMAAVHVRRLLHPNGVFMVDFNKLKVSDDVVRSVLGFMMLYFFSFAVLSVALTVTGLDAISGLSGAASAMGNVGPGLGGLIGPAGTYQHIPGAAKWLLALGMVLGRLEVVPMFVLLTPVFWRK